MEVRFLFLVRGTKLKRCFAFLSFMTDEVEHPPVILLSTGAIGDMVIASALAAQLYQRDIPHGIVSSGFTLPLWKHFGFATTYAYGPDTSIPELPSDAVVVDIRRYLRHFPHSSFLPGTERKGHLCEWMAVEIVH